MPKPKKEKKPVVPREIREAVNLIRRARALNSKLDSILSHAYEAVYCSDDQEYLNYTDSIGNVRDLVDVNESILNRVQGSMISKHPSLQK